MQVVGRPDAEASSQYVVKGDSSKQIVELLAERQERMLAGSRISSMICRDDAGMMISSIGLSKHVFPMAHAEGPSVGLGGSGGAALGGSGGAALAQVRLVCLWRPEISAMHSSRSSLSHVLGYIFVTNPVRQLNIMRLHQIWLSPASIIS